MQSTFTRAPEECSQLPKKTTTSDTCNIEVPEGWGKTHVPGVHCNSDNETVDIMLIGEAPGASEDELGRPFVGKAGQLLQQTLVRISVTKNLYITNVIKYRPPKNRKPTQLEMIEMGQELCREILELKPKVIVCLGRSPAEYMMYLGETTKKGSLRGHSFPIHEYSYSVKEQQVEPIWSSRVLCTWHPSFILRRRDKMPELEHDLLLAKEWSSNDLAQQGPHGGAA